MPELKILQVYDYMKLGGAESHIITLSKALMDLGHNVHIVSSAGPAVPRIHELGIPFHELDVYNPNKIFTNAEMLLNIIEEEKFDIVHAHPFQSQVVMSLVKLIKQVPIVTTIHGPYNTPAVGGLEDFFDGFIFVSEETEKYHFEKLKINISYLSRVIPNSVPFTLGRGFSEINPKEVLKIIYVSRLDNDKFPSILFFMNCIEHIKKYINIEVTIVGQGSKYNDVLRMANKINNNLDQKVVKVINGAVNIFEYMEKADVVIGVGRVILEALSLNKIPICIGNTNYVGIVNKENLLEISKVNFTDRNSSLCLSPTYFIDDLLKIKSEPEQVLEHLDETIQIAMKNYNISISAKKHEDFYNEVISRFSNKSLTIENTLYNEYDINNLGTLRAALSLKQQGNQYILHNARDIRVLIMPDFSDESDNWATTLTRLQQIDSINSSVTLVIRIENKFQSQLNEIINEIQTILIQNGDNEKLDILIDCEYFDKITEYLFLSEIDYFIPTNKEQYEMIFKCRLLGIQIDCDFENIRIAANESHIN